jgi:hypothetical protein
VKCSFAVLSASALLPSLMKQRAFGGTSAYPGCPVTIPAMKIGMMPIACAITLLTGCGPADQYATFILKILFRAAPRVSGASEDAEM